MNVLCECPVIILEISYTSSVQLTGPACAPVVITKLFGNLFTHRNDCSDGPIKCLVWSCEKVDST